MVESLTIHALLTTYLVHSTILIGGAWLVVRLWRPAPGAAEWLWKAALVGGLVTCAAQHLLPAAHFGPTIGLQMESPTTASASAAAGSPGEFDAAAGRGSPREEAAIATAARTAAESSGITKPARLPERPRRLEISGWNVLTVVWLMGCAIAAFRLLRSFVVFYGIHGRSRRVSSGELANSVAALALRMGVRQPVGLYLTDEAAGPMAFGLHGWRLYLPAVFVRRLDADQLQALLAHELAHLVRRDTHWNLVAEFVCGVFFFQPLNFVVRRQLRIEAEYSADRRTAEVSADGLGLARCLTALAEWTQGNRQRRSYVGPIAAGMGSYRSLLGKRVVCLLSDASPAIGVSGRLRAVCVLASFGFLALIIVTAPRVLARGQVELAVAAALSNPVEAADPPVAGEPVVVALADEPAARPAEFPAGLRGFSGLLVGRVVHIDVDRGLVKLHVQKVAKVWRGSRAESPQSSIGKTFTIDGIAGRWLDVLLTLEEGDTIEIEGQHVSGEKLNFLGEGFQKVAPLASEPQRREQYYQKVLDVPATGQLKPRIEREQGRARASIAAIKFFEMSDVSRVADGSYDAESLGYEGPLYVNVLVRDGRIESVKVTRHREKQFYSALTDTPAKIIARQGVQGVDATSGATITEAIINATAKALASGAR